MGIGMSIPYLVVALFPSLVSFLPKPGKWMQYVKYFLGILLLLTLIWIANIILNHFNYYFIIASIFLLIVTIYFIIRYSQNFVIVIITLFIFLSMPLFNFFKQQQYNTTGEGWQDFFEIQIEDLISNNDIVFLDITADWCATCQFNKIYVLNNKEVIKAFNKNNIIKVRADWTRPNKQIDMFLNKHNRFGIPFNAFFSKNYPRGMILSELLSEKRILEAIKQIKQ
jgi:suppressor for copper-sensitivity B